MESTLDVRTLDPRFKTGLIFSLYEGLLVGQSIRLISDQDPTEIQSQFKHAHIENVSWSIERIGSSVWEIEILKTELKKNNTSGCCGMCGTHGG